MIIVRLIGGLGNQMFQYATARAVAYRTNMPLKLDVTAFANYKLRPYRLGCFNIIEDFATDTEVRRFRRPRRRQIIAFTTYEIRKHLLPSRGQKFVEERGPSFDPGILKIDGGAYFAGYWASEKYFADVSGIIRHEFTFKREPEEMNRKMIAMIDSTNSVSLHIRRGDYISNPVTNRFHGVLGLDYYSRAVNFIASRTTQPHFFVFSDDIAWAKENLRLSFPLSFIEHYGADRDYEDLRLMSRCKHHIIANSTFSWWGAWLNANPEKIVVSPEKWFNVPSLESKDLIPESWVKV